MKKLTIEDKSYIAGFLDGDGCVFAQIVRGKDYKYQFRIRVSVGFYQRKDKHWFILKLKKLLGFGSARIRKDGMSEYVITGANPVEYVLLALKNHVIIKKKNVDLILEIIEKKRNINSKEEFIQVCALVDKSAELNYSKRRSVTSEVVSEVLLSTPNFL